MVRDIRVSTYSTSDDSGRETVEKNISGRDVRHQAGVDPFKVEDLKRTS